MNDLHLGERERRGSLAQELGVPFVDIERVQIDECLFTLVPPDVLRKHQVVPVKKEGVTLWLAMSDVLNVAAQDEIRDLTHCRVIPVLAVGAQIDAVLAKWLNPQAGKG